MAEQKPRKQICAGLVAHVDAGKTTLSEAILYRGGALRRLGRVDHGDAFLDTDQTERARGITIFSKQALIDRADTRITLIDTPGHVDFSAEMERCLSVLDYAVLVVSGTDGVQAHTRTLWQLLKRYRVPVFLFVNKMDAPGADKAALLAQLQRELDEACIDFTERDDEQLALCGEDVMERYLQRGALSDEDVAALVSRRAAFPCYFGSALKLTGVQALLDGLCRYTLQKDYPDEFSARVFKIARDERGTRLTFLKVTGGTLHVKDVLTGDGYQEKADQLRLYSGDKFTLLQEAAAGTVCAVTGLSRTMPGEGFGAALRADAPVLQPVLEYRVAILDGSDVQQAYTKLRVLEEEDPQLHLVWNAQLREIRAQLMGEVQMEVLQRKVKERFDLDIAFDEGNIVYNETIAAPVEGVGHYEPLRHYAEVHLLLEPGAPGSGLQFDTMCAEDTLARSYQRLVLSMLACRDHPGVLTGAPVTDLRITLIAGRAHEKHTEGGDFRQATFRAVRQGLRKAKSVLLEPYYRFHLTIPQESVGRAMTDLQRMQGELEAPQTQPDGMARLVGAAPVRLLRGYQREVTAYTRGLGQLSCQIDGYRPCADQERIVQQIGYDPERDLLNPTGSIFCAHGAGFEVKWDEVDRYAHLPLLDFRPKQERPTRIVRAVAAGGAAALDQELLQIFERTYGAIRRRDFPGVMAMRADNKRALLERIEPADEYLLVDGYNIIFAWEELKAVARDNLDAARHLLMNLLCNYQGYRGCALIVVFDAYRVAQNPGSVERYHNIYLVYTKQAETADQYIERVTYELRHARRKVRVATSDGLEQLIIVGHNAERVSAEHFHDEVMNAMQNIQRILEENQKRNG